VSVTTTPISSPFANAIVLDTDADNTPENNVRGGASTVYQIFADNTLNAGAASYLKFYDIATAVVGTTDPVLIIPIAQGGTANWVNLSGFAFLVGLSFACVTAGGTGGVTGPSSNVTVRILCT
jgi:hypothetical protein